MEQKLETIQSEYKQLSDIEHVLLRSEMYTGSREYTELTKYLLHADGKVYPEVVNIVPAALLFANEILCNSFDEAVRTRKPGNTRAWQITTIDVVVDLQRKSLTVRDDGGIPVAIDSVTNMLIPTMLFGHLRTGSNYTDDRGDVSGVNGLGSVLVNIFSHAFHVRTADGKHMFQQTWRNNLSEAADANVIESKEHLTEIIAEFDTDKVRTKIGADAYDETWARCIEGRCMELAAMSSGWEQPLTVLFKCIKEDGTEWSNRFCYRRFEDYLACWPNADSMIIDKQYRFSIAMCESAGSQESQAIVNALQCPWGTHIDMFIDACVWHIRQHINNRYHVDIKPAKIKSYIKTVSVWDINAPVFAGQTKELLVSKPDTFGMPVVPSEQFIKRLLRSKLVAQIVEELHKQIFAKRQAELNERQRDMDRKVKKNLMPSKLADAALAGRKPEACMLYIVEGDSAAGGLTKCRNAQTTGVFAMFGKSLGNQLGRDEFNVLNNKALSTIMQSLGLSFTSKNRLRYDKIVIATDADEDGSCIAALVMVFFNKFFPELIEQGHLYRLVTPIITATNLRTGELRQYYTIDDYKADKASVRGRDWEVKYNKGLASLSDQAYDIIMANPVLCQMTKDDLADSSIGIWFGSDSSYRKEAMAIGDDGDDFLEQLANGDFTDDMQTDIEDGNDASNQ